MSKPKFTWAPDLGAEQKTKPNIHQTKFGDGYELRVSTGINVAPKTWSVRFTKSLAEAMEVLAFLEAREGRESFEWTDPLDREAIYVCREWSGSQQQFGVYSISATFEQVFEY